MQPGIPTEAQVLQYFTTVSNWGRWGADDQLGNEGGIVELAPVRQDVRVGVGGQAELALADETPNLSPRSSLAVEE